MVVDMEILLELLDQVVVEQEQQDLVLQSVQMEQRTLEAVQVELVVHHQEVL